MTLGNAAARRFASVAHQSGGMRRFIAALLLTTASTADPTLAYEISKDGGVTIWYWQTTTCGQYAQERRLPPNVGNHASERAYVAGWLSAYDALVAGGNISGGDARLDDTMLWLDRYCLDHPFETVQSGLAEFNFKIAPGLMR
jgi:hypothetical protein